MENGVRFKIVTKTRNALIQMIRMVKSNDQKRVTMSLSSFQDGRTAMHYAAAFAKDDIVKVLLGKKADTNIAGGVSRLETKLIPSINHKICLVWFDLECLASCTQNKNLKCIQLHVYPWEAGVKENTVCSHISDLTIPWYISINTFIS